MTQDFTQKNVSARVGEIIREQIERSTLLSPETKLQDDLGMDSLELVELGITLEKRFDVPLSDAEVRHCATIDDVIQLVLRTAPEEQVRSI